MKKVSVYAYLLQIFTEETSKIWKLKKDMFYNCVSLTNENFIFLGESLLEQLHKIWLNHQNETIWVFFPELC